MRHFYSTANDVYSSGPDPTIYDVKSMGGVEGEPLIFSILYRSKREHQTFTTAMP